MGFPTGGIAPPLGIETERGGGGAHTVVEACLARRSGKPEIPRHILRPMIDDKGHPTHKSSDIHADRCYSAGDGEHQQEIVDCQR